jgi:hypothetical protein
MLDSKSPILPIREPYATLIIEGKNDIEFIPNQQKEIVVSSQ